jgi:hypothetical protein
MLIGFKRYITLTDIKNSVVVGAEIKRSLSSSLRPSGAMAVLFGGSSDLSVFSALVISLVFDNTPLHALYSASNSNS